ncbi:MAG: transcriptional regulator with XRE-family HTH domain [Paracoccaceae bacterium]|jgi:transcriptional regulator with XRE-family HTH domain
MEWAIFGPEGKQMTDLEQDDENGYFSDENSTFGDRVSAARRAMGLDHDRLSRKLGIKLKTLHGWEDDVSEPRANKLQMLAGVLNVSIIWLLTGEGEGVDDPWEQDPEANKDKGAAEMREILDELHQVRSEYSQLGERFVRLEKRLKKYQQKRM